MEDDGLLLNFNVGGHTSGSGAGPTRADVAAKGNWRAKRRVQKMARKQSGGVQKGLATAPTPIKVIPSVLPEIPEAHGNSDIQTPGPKSNRDTAPRPVKPHGMRNSQGVDKDSFLSSLFTSNPEVSNPQPVKPQLNLETTNAPLGEGSFQGLGVPDLLAQSIDTRLGIKKPTEIQRRAIPQIKDHDRDAFIIAQTGSGKTLAYLLPIISRLMEISNLNRTSGLFAVILSPTRELASQIYGVIEALAAACHWIVPGIVIGGEKRKSEKARLRKGVNILVGTPGRVADHFANTTALDLAEVRWVVLDEGDRLVDLGFEETLTEILQKLARSSAISRSQYSELPKVRSHILCSATMSGSIMRLKSLALNDPAWVRSNNETSETSTEMVPAQLKQEVLVTPSKLRLVSLAAKLKEITASRSKKVVVFFSCADSVDFHFSALIGNSNLSGVDDMEEGDEGKGPDDGAVTSSLAASLDSRITLHRLHGSLKQQDRRRALETFTASKGVSVLFCTDVASRGLDFSVDSVIEYDPPFAVEDHIHRVGRTARAGNQGSATLFLLPGPEERYVDKLKEGHDDNILHSDFKALLERSFGRKWDVEATTWHLSIERWILGNTEAQDLARKAFVSHVRAYATHLSSERAYFNVKELHLGHLAKSFGLRDPPGKISAKTSRMETRPKKKTGQNLLFQRARGHAKMGDYNVV